MGKAIEKTKKEHLDTLAEFESIVSGIESAMKGGGLAPERMTHEEIFLEIKRALSPMDPDTTRLKTNAAETEYISARQRLASVSILGQTETYLNIDGLLWTFLSLKTPPDGTYPGLLRKLMTIGFPIVISTSVSIPDQRVVLDKYKKKFRKMQAAQKDSKGNLRVDVTAQVAAQELLQIQQELIASSVKTASVSLVIGVHTSRRGLLVGTVRGQRTGTGKPPATVAPCDCPHERSARVFRIARHSPLVLFNAARTG